MGLFNWKKKEEFDDIEEQYEFMNKVNELNKGKHLKYSIFTMGCQLNENDSEKICGMLEKMGYNCNRWMYDARKAYTR